MNASGAPVVNLKGGVGKTTAAILIATQLAELGHTVTVLDMDTQGSATDWARIADEDGTPLPFEIRPANHASLRRGSGAQERSQAGVSIACQGCLT